MLLYLPGLDIEFSGRLATESVVLVVRIQTWSQNTPLKLESHCHFKGSLAFSPLLEAEKDGQVLEILVAD